MSLISCNSDQANYAWGWGFCFFFQPSGRSFALKCCPRGRDFDEKHYWPGGQPGGGGQTVKLILALLLH